MKKIILLLCVVTLTLSCSDDDEGGSNEFDGSIESIEDFFTPELVEALEDLGFAINTGNTPPNIEGTYLFSPLELSASNIPEDFIGQIFSDVLATFQNQSNLNIEYAAQGGTQTDEGTGSFITGDDVNFTVLLKLTTQIGSIPVETATAISGKRVDGGIEDLQQAVLMLDDKGDPEGVYIENNQGRMFIDSDGFSPEQ